MEQNLLGQILVNNNFITAEQLARAIEIQSRSKVPKFLGQILLQEKLITERVLNTVLSVQRRRFEAVQRSRIGVTISEIAQKLSGQDIFGYIEVSRSLGASDLYLFSRAKPAIRLHGNLIDIDSPPLFPTDVDKLLLPLLTDEQKETFDRTGDIEVTQALNDGTRFRASLFRDYKGTCGIFRIFRGKPARLSELGLPRAVSDLANLSQGLILITGPVSSGKSTVLTALVEEINSNSKGHIVTIEDPVEVVLSSRGCVVTQREIGKHTASFAIALRAALREDPDYIVVTELKDEETITTAIQAAETGHLVLGTLHTTNSVRTINRIVDAFPAQQQQQIRSMLSGTLRAIISLQLVPNIDGRGRSLAKEILFITPAIANLIREDKPFQIPQHIQTGAEFGMQLMDDSFAELVFAKKISFEEAIMRAEDKDKIARLKIQ
jgi:twitching motility protein PilT